MCVCARAPAPPSVRELQQDARESNQADLSEVDPEENSAEFMGILIKVDPRRPSTNFVCSPPRPLACLTRVISIVASSGDYF